MTSPITASAENTVTTPGAESITTTCSCTAADALHWVALLSEDAYHDADLAALLPAAFRHYDAVVAREDSEITANDIVISGIPTAANAHS